MPTAILDHLVLPTARLAVARTRLEALGFTVAPNGLHPFGTENCCVYFADGTFLEPLAIADHPLAEAATQQGNVFVARDAAFRQAQSNEGMSALVLRSDDALADDQRFKAASVSAGPVLDFQRPVTDAAGRSDIAAFRLAFAADALSPSSYFFTCQRVTAPLVDRTSLQRHANGASGIVGVSATAREPDRHIDFLSRLLDGPPAFLKEPGVWHWQLGDTVFSLRHGESDGMQFAEVRFGVADLAALAALFNQRSIAYEGTGKTIAVHPAAGQGVLLVFEEAA